MDKGVQDIYGPNGTCFGCGPKNDKGLQIKSYWDGEDFVMHFNPQTHHAAFPGVVNGGIIGALFDCHMNWLTATKLYELNSDQEFPSTVTSEFAIKLIKPTPLDAELMIKAQILEISGNIVKTKASMYVEGNKVASATGTFVSVKKGHPAYHRWN